MDDAAADWFLAERACTLASWAYAAGFQRLGKWHLSDAVVLLTYTAEAEKSEPLLLEQRKF